MKYGLAQSFDVVEFCTECRSLIKKGFVPQGGVALAYSEEIHDDGSRSPAVHFAQAFLHKDPGQGSDFGEEMKTFIASQTSTANEDRPPRLYNPGENDFDREPTAKRLQATWLSSAEFPEGRLYHTPRDSGKKAEMEALLWDIAERMRLISLFAEWPIRRSTNTLSAQDGKEAIQKETDFITRRINSALNHDA